MNFFWKPTAAEHAWKHSVHCTNSSSALPNATEHQSLADVRCRFSHFTLFMWDFTLFVYSRYCVVRNVSISFGFEWSLSLPCHSIWKRTRTWHMFSFFREQEGQLRIIRRTVQTCVFLFACFIQIKYASICVYVITSNEILCSWNSSE